MRFLDRRPYSDESAICRAAAEVVELAGLFRAIEHERWMRLVNGLTEGVAVIHCENFHVLEHNPAAAKLLGVSEAELMDRPFIGPPWDVICENGNTMKAKAHPVAVACRTGEPMRGTVLGVRRVINDVEDRVWLLFNAVPSRRSDGIVDAAVVTFRDVTERRRER